MDVDLGAGCSWKYFWNIHYRLTRPLYGLIIDCSDTDEGDMGLDSTVLVDDNITDCDVTDEDQEMIERVRSSFYFPH